MDLPLNIGAMSTPAHSVGIFAPATEASVGSMSMKCHGRLPVLPLRIFKPEGQCAIVGHDMPPSCV
jgi:hypothetical protein